MDVSETRPFNHKLFIALEGIDGSGTTTQLRLIEKHEDPFIVTTAEPTDQPIGKCIRKLLQDPNTKTSTLTFLQLFSADRRNHLENLILPAMGANKKVICDRYILSTFAYQDELNDDDIWWANRYQVKEGELVVPIPQTMFFLDVQVDIALDRIHARAEGKDNANPSPNEIFETELKLKKARERYLKYIDKFIGYGCDIHIIDGQLAPGIIHDRIWSRIQKIG